MTGERPLTLTVYNLNYGPIIIMCSDCGTELWDAEDGDNFTAEQLIRAKCDCQRGLKTTAEAIKACTGSEPPSIPIEFGEGLPKP